MSTIKLRTKRQDNKTLVRLMIDHPMETGRRRDEVTGKTIPAHYITELKLEHNGKLRVRGMLSTAISRNPYFSFRLDDVKPNDIIRVTWIDNQGGTDSQEIRVTGAAIGDQDANG
jgi:sulfur-oxidizing protein SoxZ